eukprot:COSAG02_NODE_782_length_17259_cov_36.492599_14_plen_36_part_00
MKILTGLQDFAMQVEAVKDMTDMSFLVTIAAIPGR